MSNAPHPLAWIDSPDADTAGESLGRIVENRIRHVLRKMYGDEAAATERGNARVQYKVLETLAKVEKIGRTEILRRAREAAGNPWFRHCDEEFDSVKEMLISAIGPETSESIISDVVFLVEEAIPFLQAHEIDGASALIGKSAAASAKARALVPQLRAALRADNEQAAKEVFVKGVEKLADPKVSEADIRRENQTGKAIPEFTVLEYLHPDGSTLVLTGLSSRQRAWAENRLGPKATWKKAHKGTRTARVLDVIGAQVEALKGLVEHVGDFQMDDKAKAWPALQKRVVSRCAGVLARLTSLARSIAPEPEEVSR